MISPSMNSINRCDARGFYAVSLCWEARLCICAEESPSWSSQERLSHCWSAPWSSCGFDLWTFWCDYLGQQLDVRPSIMKEIHGSLLMGKKNFFRKENSLKQNGRIVAGSWKAEVLSHAVLPPELVLTIQAHMGKKGMANMPLRY